MFDNNFDFVDLFEQRLCDYTGFKYAVCVDCCTNGILVSLEMLKRTGVIDKNDMIRIPKKTYMSVPMTLINNGWRIELVDEEWRCFYQIGNTGVFDSATDLHENMSHDYGHEATVCVSFQQKKRLSLGRGGVIFTNLGPRRDMLKRMIHDGRNSRTSQMTEVNERPDDIVLGYHCYLEPEKAAIGITKLNQPLPEYVEHSFLEYPDLCKLKTLR
jgi:dTDP-4-amino-4,6-dideoxygalactose transaminase